VKNVTFSLDEKDVEDGRKQAAEENTTLNNLVREWLKQYVARQRAAAEYRALMERLSYVNAGRKFTREEMNER